MQAGITKHELFAELDMFCSGWQTRYPHLRDAAIAAKALDLYADWLSTAEGKAYSASLRATYDLFKEQTARVLSARAIEDMAVAMDLSPITEDGDE